MATMAASFIASMAYSLIQPVASSMINTVTGKGVMRAEEGQKVGFFY